MLTANLKRFDNDEAYYSDHEYLNFSGLKVFSKCETLYRDQFMTHTYEAPDKDYFIYGKVVDCLLTTPGDIDKLFVRVDRKVDPEKALQIENDIKTLQLEMTEPNEKGETMETKAAAGNKTCQKGIEKRKKEIEENQEKLKAITESAAKQQVTGSIWEEAHATAEAIKQHPYFKTMEFNGLTSQQSFAIEDNGLKMKGKLDYLRMSQPMTELYSIYCSGLIELIEMQKQIASLPHTEKWAVIVDIKSCFSLAKLEPWNYRGQLRFYQILVESVFGVRPDCYILVGDKMKEFKMTELFHYSQNVLSDLDPDIIEWRKRWSHAIQTNTFVSNKVKNGWNQDCFTCIECRTQPFSKTPGQPVEVMQPRFEHTAGVISDEEVQA